jgi:hypothetical protein
MGTVRWGSDWTFSNGDWWSALQRPEPDVSYVARRGEPGSFEYFWADILSGGLLGAYFPGSDELNGDLRDLWLGPWVAVPTD